MQKKINISGILLIVVLIIFLFFPQLLLLQPFDHINFPLGTPITWIGMIALNSLMYYLHILRIKNPASLGSIIKAILKLFMRLSYCWGIIGFLLAANWSMSFSGSIPTFRGSYDASLVFWAMNYILIAAPILLFFIGWLLKKHQRS